MPRVTHVKAARKDNPAVKKGEPYYWWKFAFGPKMFSATPPRQSQLTRSEYYTAAYSLQEDFEAADKATIDDATSALEDALSAIEELKDETEEKVYNMEEAFPNGCPALETCQERVYALESLVDEVENTKSEIEGFDPDEYDGQSLDEAIDDQLSNLGWDFE